MLKVANSVISASRITGVLPVVNGGTGVTTSTGTGNTVLSATPTLSGDVSLSTGNLIPSTAAKGVNFTANTPSATGTMTSQLLNWYEEGTWVPGQGSGLILVGAFSSNGKYTRIGRQVTVSFGLEGATSIAWTGGNQQLCTNLPFTGGSASTGVIFNSARTAFVGIQVAGTAIYASGTLAATTDISGIITYFV